MNNKVDNIINSFDSDRILCKVSNNYIKLTTKCIYERNRVGYFTDDRCRDCIKCIRPSNLFKQKNRKAYDLMCKRLMNKMLKQNKKLF